MFVKPSSFHHTDRGANKNSGVCTAKLVGTRTSFHHTDRVATNMFVHFISRSDAQPNTPEEEHGREAIVAELELTEVHDEDTEKHPGVGELDLIVGVHAPGEMRKTHHVSAHSPFPAMAATSCGMPVDILKLLIHQLTQLLQAFLCDTAAALDMRPSLIG